VDVGDHIERARAALAAHRTQVAPDGPWFRVPLELVREVYPYEDFELLASRVDQDGVVTDLFEGV
jgi:mycothiol S-conjugate amidase